MSAALRRELSAVIACGQRRFISINAHIVLRNAETPLELPANWVYCNAI